MWSKWLLISALLSLGFCSQSPAPPVPWEGCGDSNVIQHAEHLTPLFERLYQLEKAGTGTVNILHIGDSHIQGNYMTDQIRKYFYADFGQASRGLMFPFQVAQTNTPTDISSYSRTKWEIRKNTQVIYSPQMGICGRVIGNSSPFSSFNLKVNPTVKESYFNEVLVFYTQVTKNSFLLLRDSIGNALPRVSRNMEKGFVTDRYLTTDPIRYIKVQGTSLQGFQGNCYLHGLYLGNTTRTGITYNVAGVNGSQYCHWAASRYLAAQSTYLRPDLVIISLGTNEANDILLSTDVFTKDLDKLVGSLRSANPGATILLTTPPDSYYKKRYANLLVDRIRQTILLYAERNNLACWDLYGVMGGENSILEWQKEGLASKDLIHFTKPGYQLQGELFYKAFISHYTHYATTRPK